ncbi:hypothetical protein H5410_034975 [Solanum commersonii]|uniref:MIF4G domain-containing protein n=1 Tax=Solanum commersonii TaxID=4109 RepID=A0A9J5Y1L7_SOLCO|nr:hypothetical protein H5410_034975 [Solanum commersonii]
MFAFSFFQVNLKLLEMCCDHLNEMLPSFLSNEHGGESTAFKCVLWNNCQEAIEGTYKLRRRNEANSEHMDKEIKFIKSRTLGELELLGEKPKCCPPEENVEAICHNIGKVVDERQDSRNINNLYFGSLNRLSTNPQLAQRLRLMVCDLLDLRTNNWIPKPILIL